MKQLVHGAEAVVGAVNLFIAFGAYAKKVGIAACVQILHEQVLEQVHLVQRALGHHVQVVAILIQQARKVAVQKLLLLLKHMFVISIIGVFIGIIVTASADIIVVVII